MIGPDSDEDVYNGLIETVEKNGFDNYKIVYAEHVIPYAYVIPYGIDGVTDWGAWQICPIDDLKYICPELYEQHSNDGQINAYDYVMWRPYESNNGQICNYECGNQHHEVYKGKYIKSIIDSFWQLIPTDENENDILRLASGSEVLLNSLHSVN